MIVVRVTAGPDWQLAGVLGLPGTIEAWTSTLTDAKARHLVPDDPLTADGPVTIRYEPAEPTTGEPS